MYPHYFCHSREGGNSDNKALTLIDPRRSLPCASIWGEDDKRIHAFTLIELLIVIAIIAILSIVVVLSLNPQEMLRQSRDGNRVSDMDTLTHALSLYQEDQGTSGGFGFLGTATVIYLSLPDSSSTCGSWSLPAPPSGYTYQCASPQTYRNVNGQGWIPLNFSSITTGAPLGQLPIDPINASSTGLYYTYVTNGSSYEVTSLLESQKYKSQYATNPSIQNYPEVNAKGSSLTINPLFSASGLVGYWPMDEGTGTTAYDQSGSGNNGALSSPAPAWTGGKVGSGALSFNGTSNYVSARPASTSSISAVTLTHWFQTSITTGIRTMFQNSGDASVGYDTFTSEINRAGPGELSFEINTVGGGPIVTLSSKNYADGGWHFLSVTYDGTTLKAYVDGGNIYSSTSSVSGNILAPPGGSTAAWIGAYGQATTVSGQYFQGLLDDIRVYNRALSAAEIMALYDAEK